MVMQSWSYIDRHNAGEVLVEQLESISFDSAPLVLAVPNGGVAVAFPIVQSLKADLDLILVRKLQIPYNPEAGFGALTSLGTLILNKPLVSRLGLSDDQIDLVRAQTERQIVERKSAYSGLVGQFSPSARHVVLVDDGLASGYTMLSAVTSVRESNPVSITVAVPTASQGAARLVGEAVDRLICPRIERGFIFAVANAYKNWYDVPDEEVVEFLRLFRERKYSSRT